MSASVSGNGANNTKPVSQYLTIAQDGSIHSSLPIEVSGDISSTGTINGVNGNFTGDVTVDGEIIGVDKYVVGQAIITASSVSTTLPLYVDFNSSMKLPTGTTLERPSGGDLLAGDLRFNTTTPNLEWYDGTQWVQPASSGDITALQNKTQYQTAASNVTSFAGGEQINVGAGSTRNLLVTNGTQFIQLIPDSSGSGGDASLIVSNGVTQSSVTNLAVNTATVNATTVAATTLNVNDINMSGSGSELIMKDNSNATKITLNPNDPTQMLVAEGTVQASKFIGYGSLIPFQIEDISGQVCGIDSSGNLTANSFLLNGSDAQITSAGAASFVSVQASSGDFLGNIDMNTDGKIVNLIDGTDPQDAAAFNQIGAGITAAIGSSVQAYNSNLTTLTTSTTGDVIYSSATNTLSKLAASTDGKVLTLASGLPSWQDPSSGGGPTWTTETDSYSLSAKFVAPANQLSFSSISTYNMYCQCVSSSNFAIYSPKYDSGANSIYVFTISNGILTYASTYTTTYNYPIVKCVGNDVVVLSTNTSTLNTSVSHLTYSAGTLTSSSVIYSVGSCAQGYGLDMQDLGAGKYLISFAYQNSAYTQTNYFCYYYSGAAWSLCTNAPFSATNANVNANFDRTILIGDGSTPTASNPWQLGYVYSGASLCTVELRNITSGTPPSISSSITQTISQSNNSPSTAYNDWTYSKIVWDGSNATYKYLHCICANGNGGGTKLGGAFRSYAYASSTWGSVLDWLVNTVNGGISVTNDKFGFTQYSYDSNNGSAAFYNDTMCLCSSTGVIQQFAFTKGAGSLSVAFVGPELIPHSTRTAQDGNIITVVFSPDGSQLFSSINVATKYLIGYLRSGGSTVTVDYEETADNIRETNRLAIKSGGGFLEMGTTTLAQLPAAGTYSNGAIYFDGTYLWILINGVWRSIYYT